MDENRQDESGTGSREIAEIVENSMADFREAMRVREELSVRIGRRTSQIIRVGAISVGLLSFAIVYLTASLNRDMSLMLKQINTMTSSIQKMESHVSEMGQNMSSLPVMTSSVTAMQQDVSGMNRGMEVMNHQVGQLNSNVGAMGYDVNRMSSPTRMLPFSP